VTALSHGRGYISSACAGAAATSAVAATIVLATPTISSRDARNRSTKNMYAALSATDRLSTGQATLAVSRIDPQATSAGPSQDIGHPVAVVVTHAHELGQVASADPQDERVLQCRGPIATVEDQRVVAGPKRDDVPVGVIVERAGPCCALHALPPRGDGHPRLEGQVPPEGVDEQVAVGVARQQVRHAIVVIVTGRLDHVEDVPTGSDLDRRREPGTRLAEQDHEGVVRPDPCHGIGVAVTVDIPDEAHQVGARNSREGSRTSLEVTLTGPCVEGQGAIVQR